MPGGSIPLGAANAVGPDTRLGEDPPVTLLGPSLQVFGRGEVTLLLWVLAE